jgi:hypothetical protein
MPIYLWNNQILTVDGKIAINEACCCVAAECPTDCSSLGNYTNCSISSIGGGCENCDSTYEGRTYTLTRGAGTACTWSDNTWEFDQYEILISLSCNGTTDQWEISVYLNCFDSISCFYEATLTGSIAAKANPTGTYNISGDGLTATFTVA